MSERAPAFLARWLLAPVTSQCPPPVFAGRTCPRDQQARHLHHVPLILSVRSADHLRVVRYSCLLMLAPFVPALWQGLQMARLTIGPRPPWAAPPLVRPTRAAVSLRPPRASDGHSSSLQSHRQQ